MESAQVPVFIETEDLQKLLDQGSPVRLFDCTAEEDPIANYKAKHIPRAEFLDLRYLRDMSKPYNFMMPTEAHFTEFIKLHNLKPNSTRIVFYDTKPKTTYWATRAYWMFTVFGFKNVSVLNGGLHKWAALEQRATETDKDFGSAEDFKVTLNQDMVFSYEQICELEIKIEAKESDV